MGTLKSHLLLCALCIALTVTEISTYTPVSRGCDERSCYPATGNLLIGRQDKLTSTSTCGDTRRERYCILSHLDYSKKNQKCFWCDSTETGTESNPRTSHKVKNIVYRMEPPEPTAPNRFKTWWQAKHGEESATLQLDLEAEFHVTHLIITFKTFRPAAMFIEKSYDWGVTWKIHRYFAHDCEQSFPGVHIGAPRFLNETVCQSRYSRVTPSTLGSVIYRVLPPNIDIRSPGFNPYSKEVQDLLKTTNLRIHMTKLHTLGDENLQQTNRMDIKEKYYYSIYDMTVRGSCSCYGHAERCLPEKEEHKDILGMVHGKCDCTHNTKGHNCEYCIDDYNDVPWQPATGKKKNECKKCNCYDHADTCMFSPYIYASTSNVSGGVCESCSHNTEGLHCELCKEGFFRDPVLELNHPEVCKECDCDPDGTTDGGICDTRTDEEEGMVSGKCHCKTFVGGPRCDRCLNGYWNYTLENPDGCQECTCNINGIVSDDGCDQEIGDCNCKRNVEGRDCNQCLPQHYGLSFDDPSGCKPCECDLGGAYDNNCDVISGMCKCRPNVSGRKCDHVEDGFYAGPLDFLLFEGELAFGTQNPPTKVIRREPSREPGGSTWTGPGFMQVYEGSDLTFDVPSIFSNLSYDMVVRYEHLPNQPEDWKTATMQLIPVYPDDPADMVTNPDCATNQTFEMKKDQRFVVLDKPLCMEEGKQYQIKLSFDQYDENNPDPKASILIDSIALIPQTKDLSMWDRDPEATQAGLDFDTMGCRDLFLTVPQPEIPKECSKLLNSISFFAFGGGINKPCECDVTGSESTLCDKYAGDCPCKKNVVGRRCDRCAPGTFGFGADGCRACNCHNLGSFDPFCRETDGQCNCQETAYGRRCNECQPGYWNFPNCQICECNGHADTCDAETGSCHECRDGTEGDHCEICLNGYYGNPILGVDIPCRECPCPNTPASGHSFAERCYLDVTTNEPVCECEEGYSGARCSVCADNFHGNPEIPGGSCVPCNCSNNWNSADTGNCDLQTGECLKCVFNTDGEHCEFCKAGFYGDAVNDMCKECVCNIMGTDKDNFDCDRFSGDCHCLPNVEGKSCDTCAPDHWKLASGLGCDYCDCDPVGSTSKTCNEYNGQCVCKPGFGGRRCDQCEENYWGDPQVECYPCNCNPHGSQSYQCDHKTGKCICLEGIGGEKCDECARGFVQEMGLSADHPVLDRYIPHDDMPRCQDCGECFTNWDRILSDLRNQTDFHVSHAERVKVTGVTGAYTRDFEAMETNLQDIKSILNSASISNEELIGVQNDIDRINAAVRDTTSSMDDLDSDLTNVRQSQMHSGSNLDFLRSQSDQLKMKADDMKDQVTRLQEANVEGALNLTRDAKWRSDEAAIKVREIQADGGMLTNSELQRRATEKLMNNSRLQFSNTQETNQNKLDDILEQIDNLEGKIPDLNKQICDGQTSLDAPCHDLCGGAGCQKCGGLACLNGALSKAEDAVKSAMSADIILVEKDEQAEQILQDMTQVQQKAMAAAQDTQMAYDKASEAKNRSMGEMERANGVKVAMYNFFNEEKATPASAKELADECLNSKMELESSEIVDLAEQINTAIDSVTNVDQILASTSADLQRAGQLKRRANYTQQLAEEALKEAEGVTSNLADAVEAQNKVDLAVQAAQRDIDTARKDMSQISNTMDEAKLSSDTSFSDVTDLSSRQQHLQTSFIKNEKMVTSARDAAGSALQQASAANGVLYKLNSQFKNVTSSLETKNYVIGSAKDRAIDLQRRANELASSASNKITNINDVEKEFEETERRLTELSSELISLNCELMMNLQTIEDKSNFYRTCAPPGSWVPSATCQCLPDAMEPTCEQKRSAQGF